MASEPCTLVHRGARCTELRLPGGLRVLLDYGAEPACLLHYWPLCTADAPAQAPGPSCVERQGWWHLQSRSRLEVPQLPPGELGAISAVLVTGAEAMLALPLLTERDTGFTGAVYATYAALQLGTQLILEFARMHGGQAHAPARHAPHLAPAAVEPLAPPVPAQSAAQTPAAVASFLGAVWARGQLAYTEAEARACASRIAGVSYGQIIQLTPDGGVVASAHPSGSSIGAACWAVDAYGCRLSLLCEPSVAAAADTASASLSAARPLELPPPLHAPDALLLRNLRPRDLTPTADGLATLLSGVTSALADGVSVLLPRHPCTGATLGLIEALAAELQRSQPAGRPPHCIFLLSPVAEQGLAHANSLPEWLDPPRGSRACEPTLPFAFESLVAEGRLVCASSGAEIRLPIPAVVIASDPSLRIGQAAGLLEAWRQPGTGRDALLVLTHSTEDAGVSGDEEHFARLLAPFSPMKRIRLLICVLDTRATEHQAARLIHSIRPKMVVLPPAAGSPARLSAPPPPSHVEIQGVRTPIARMIDGVPLQVAPERTFAVASLAGGAAESLVVRCLPSGLHVAHASLLLRQDHASGPRLVLDPDPGPAANTEGGHGVLSGQVDAQVLLRALRARGLPAAVAGERGAGRGGETGACAIEMEGARVLLRGDETTVFGSDFETVVLVNEAIREQLHSF